MLFNDISKAFNKIKLVTFVTINITLYISN